MVKLEPLGVIEMVERAFGAADQGDDHVVVATDFVLELTPAEKRQLDQERSQARERLLAAG